MSGEWSGGSANRTWQRKGHRGGRVEGDTERGERLFEDLAATPFFCETCGGSHPLDEHQACRAEQAAEYARQARQAVTVTLRSEGAR